MAVQRLGDAAEVEPVGADAEDAHPAHAVERLEDDVAVLGVEAADLGRLARDQRRRDVLRELQDRQLLRVVAQRARTIEHARALALGLLQQVGGVEVLAVEGRILAHQHRVDLVQRLGAAFAGQLGRAPPVRRAGLQQLDVAHRRRDRATGAPVAAPAELARLAGHQRVAAARRLAHHGVGGVLGDLEPLQRVGDEQ